MSETTGGGKLTSGYPSSLTHRPEEIELAVVTGSSPGLANTAGVPPPGFAAPLPPREDTCGEPERPIASWAVAREPSQVLAARHYRDVAPGYDAWTVAWQAYRQRAVETLAPAAGSVVLDVGCGTGLNFAGLEQAIGPRGRLIGIDLSPDMLARAHERVQNHGWHNVTLLQAAGQDAALPVEADAALLSAVHDILRSPVALANVLTQLRSGGRVVASGPKWVPWWQPASLALNSCAWLINRHCVTTFEGFDAPWSHLARLLPDLAVEEVFFGAGFIAVGTRPAASPAARAQRKRSAAPPRARSGPIRQAVDAGDPPGSA
jgi:SAM-dependent methyltransferase